MSTLLAQFERRRLMTTVQLDSRLFPNGARLFSWVSRRGGGLLILCGLAGWLFCSTAAAQGDRGGDDSSDRGGRRSRGESGRSWDVGSFLKRMDANGNGRLEGDEMSGRTARFVEQLGFDTSRDVSIEEVVAKANGESGAESDSNQKSGQSKSSSGRVIVRLVPGFETVGNPTATVPGFGATSQISSAEDISKQYGENVAGQVERAMRRYDRNENGILDADEVKEGQWGNPGVEESDLNKDGALTLYELAERYKSRENAQDRNSSSDRRSSDSGNDRSSGGRSFGRDRSTRGGGDERGGDERGGERGGEDLRSRMERENSRRDTEVSSSSQGDSARSSGSTSFTGTASTNERMRAYADSLVKQYDKDGDGQLNKDEISKMKRVPEGADMNKDGMVTAGELTDALAGGNKVVSTSSQSAPPVRERNSARNRREESGSSSAGESRRGFSFNSSDKNGNGQVEMHEFTDEWTEELLAEFRRMDKNNDGIITAAESVVRDK